MNATAAMPAPAYPLPPPEKQCVGCHQRILGGDFEAKPETIARWQGNIKGLVDAPSLEGSQRRLKRDWVLGFLDRPNKIRPHLPASMPRLSLSKEERETLANSLGGDDGEPFTASAASIDAGRKLYAELACGKCHRFSGAAPEQPRDETALGVIMAPDLALSRRRLRASAVVALLLDPSIIRKSTAMPSFGLTKAQARELAAFVLLSPRTIEAQKPAPARLAVLKRPVAFEEVEARLFKKVCWHCHSDPAYAMGDGGPGNTGGFGYPARGLDLSSYRGIMKGAFDDRGQRRSIFVSEEDGTPRLVKHLLARQSEECGERIEGITGMPLGFPALSPEDIQLVESWIAQGRRR